MKKFMAVFLSVCLILINGVALAGENLGFPKGNGQGEIGKSGRSWGQVWTNKVTYGFTTHAYSSATGATLAVPDSDSTAAIYKITGGSGTTTFVMSYTGSAASNKGKIFYIINTSSCTVTFKQTGATGISIATLKNAMLVGNGTDFERVTADQAQ